MADLQKAAATQLSNIEKKTGHTLAQLSAAVAASGHTKHGEVRDWIKTTYGLGHGDANALAHHALAAPSSASSDVLGEIYSGKKAHLRPIHEALMTHIAALGPFEVAPKKGYVALRRKKQFAMLGPKTNDRFELGLNLKEALTDPRARALPAGGMCSHVVALTAASEVDAGLIALVKRAYDAAG